MVLKGTNRGEIIGRNEFDNIIIDTCFALDTGKYETGIKRNEPCVIVEMYNNKKEAIKGHKKWKNKLKKNPNLKLKNCITPLEWAGGDY